MFKLTPRILFCPNLHIFSNLTWQADHVRNLLKVRKDNPWGKSHDQFHLLGNRAKKMIYMILCEAYSK